MLQMGGGKKNTHGSLVIVELANFSFSQAVGEDMVNACWRDSNFCGNRHA
jgi:hypothetical protein